MRVAIVTLGTRGDIVPFVILGSRLREHGHEVRVATNATYSAIVRDAGLQFHCLPGEATDLYRDPHPGFSAWHPIHHMRTLREIVSRVVDQCHPDAVREALVGSDHVVFAATTTVAYYLAMELGIPSTMMCMTPALATGAFANPMLAPYLSLGSVGNLATWHAAERLQGQSFREPLRPRERREWKLPALSLDPRRQGASWPPYPMVHAYSTHLLPQPPDWPSHVDVTGWILPPLSTRPLATEIEAFLRGGEPPVYIGFGSMPLRDPEASATMCLTALRRAGMRGILCGSTLASTAAAQRGGDDVLAIADVPHERLFSRVRAVVHHGGSGTLGAGLRAGRPTLLLPYAFDQFFWSRWVSRSGLGPDPIALRRVAVDRLSDRLRDLASGRYDDAARSLGEQIRPEDGAGGAVAAIERNASVAD